MRVKEQRHWSASFSKRHNSLPQLFRRGKAARKPPYAMALCHSETILAGEVTPYFRFIAPLALTPSNAVPLNAYGVLPSLYQ